MPKKQVAFKIFQEMFGFTRMRKNVKEHIIKMLTHVVENQKKFDYNYYLSKNCPLPEDWKNLKMELTKQATQGPVERGNVFKKLYDAESSYRQVANFLTEWIAQVFPRDFLEGKNKKVFNKKVLDFVTFNRFEMFTRITLLDKFDINKISWLKFESSS